MTTAEQQHWNTWCGSAALSLRTEHPRKLRAYQGRVDAAFAEVAVERGLIPPPVTMAGRNGDAAAVAYFRARGLHGFSNRGSRKERNHAE